MPRSAAHLRQAHEHPTSLHVAWPVSRPQASGRPAGDLQSAEDFDHRLVYRHRNRIKVAGKAFQPQPLRFQR